jgi:hypothetical protein
MSTPAEDATLSFMVEPDGTLVWCEPPATFDLILSTPDSALNIAANAKRTAGRKAVAAWVAAGYPGTTLPSPYAHVRVARLSPTTIASYISAHSAGNLWPLPPRAGDTVGVLHSYAVALLALLDEKESPHAST